MPNYGIRQYLGKSLIPDSSLMVGYVEPEPRGLLDEPGLEPPSILGGLLSLDPTDYIAPTAIARALMALKGGAKYGANAIMRPTGSAFRSASIFAPKPVTQRPFNVDYPQSTGRPDGSKLLFDIEGRPLSARYIAGRNMVGMADEPLPTGGAAGINELLGIPVKEVPRTSADLKGDVGRFISGHNRRIFTDAALPDDKARMVLEHETGHALEDLVTGAKIPTTGIEKELARLYSDQNTAHYVPKGKIGATPKTQGYSKPDDIEREYMAEAIRAYFYDPNYIKTVAPKTAARIREYFNSNPNTKDVIQFNSLLAPAASGGLLNMTDGGENGTSR